MFQGYGTVMKPQCEVDMMTSLLDAPISMAWAAAAFPSSEYNFPLSKKFLLLFCRNDVPRKGSRKTSIHGPSKRWLSVGLVEL